MTPAGYSGTPLPKKLGIKEGHRVALIGAPKGFQLGSLPADVALKRDLRGSAALDVVVFFAHGEKELRKRLPALVKRVATAGGLWIAWPKKSSGVATDLSDGTVRKLGLATGLVDNKVCAVDDTWSGLRFVRRLEDR